ncbi:hypothetical protein GCM10007298_22070 [Williamsia phyllosphaerae]|uniref:Uncharacterized protein n=1 Tax=Williamsia phyllosphaerae TaxID=885042 RepID=A0ABQ1UUU7_9NOCA|nr:hypothetical protein GCM10007298_22070 [Williamsia phyllosphaerae]
MFTVGPGPRLTYGTRTKAPTITNTMSNARVTPRVTIRRFAGTTLTRTTVEVRVAPVPSADSETSFPLASQAAPDASAPVPWTP